MLVRDSRKQSPPNEAQSVGRVRLGLYSPQTQLGVHLLDSHHWDLQDTGREQAPRGRGTDSTFANVCCQPEPSA